MDIDNGMIIPYNIIHKRNSNSIYEN
jgi:hypothetical protein